MAQVGQPQMKMLEDSQDGKTRWVQLRIPITEGKRYAVGNFDFDGNKVVKSEALRPLFKLEKGEYLQREGNQEGAREGAGILRRRRLHGVHRLSGSEAARPPAQATPPTVRPRPPVRRPRPAAKPRTAKDRRSST